MQLDDLGNVLWRREQRFESPTASTPPVRIETFGYDRLNRLKYSQVTGQALQSFTFTANGNIASKSGIGDYTYGQRNHGPHAVTSVSQGTQVQRSYTYDAKGRMTGEFNGAAVTGFALRDIKYTSFDQPKTITHLGAAALSSDPGQLDDGTNAWDQQCTIDFYFGPGLQRLIQKKVKGKLVTTTLSLGGYEIREVTGHTGTVIEREERSSFGNGVRVLRWLGPKETTSAQTSYEFAAKDHLGSDTATFDGQGELRQQRGHLKPGEVQKTERQSYDAWGARRDGDTWAPAAGQLNKLSSTEATMTSPSQEGGAPSGSPPERAGSNLPRGYTGHEMLDDVGLVHMNGRLYDSALGRMCAADPYVQSSEAIQNYNRYSYVMNNPMNATDPSGLSWLSKWWKVIVAVIIAIIIAIVAAYLLGALLNSLGGALGIAGAGGGIGGSGITGIGFAIIKVGAGVQAGMTAYSMTKGGASFGSILKAVVVSAAISGATAAISANVLHGLGEAVGSYGSGVTDAAFEAAATKGGFAVTGNMVADRVIGTIIHGAAHGIVGGAAAAAQGGSFKSGFISAVVSFGVDVIGIQTLGVSGGIYDMSNKSPMAIAGRTAVAAISGGMASVATGGKFTQAAFTAGFMHLFNTEGIGGFSLKSLQKGLKAFGKIPGIGEIADAANVGISLYQGDYAGALRNAAAMVPGVGTALDVYDAGVAINEHFNSPQVTANYQQGKAAEQRAVADLKAQGYEIHGQGVRVTDAAGNTRYPDIIATSPAGDLEAFEVKSGNARYARPQSTFDMNMETKGASSKLWDGVKTVGTKLLRY